LVAIQCMSCPVRARRSYEAHADSTLHTWTLTNSPHRCRASSLSPIRSAFYSSVLTVTLITTYIHTNEKNKNAVSGVHMSTNTVISNQDERNYHLKIQTNIHTYMIYTLWTHIKKNTYTHWYNTYVCLSCYYYTHIQNCAKYSPTYRLDQLCIRRLFDKKEYYYDYCYILLSTTPFPTKIHKKTAQLSKFYPISKKIEVCSPPW